MFPRCRHSNIYTLLWNWHNISRQTRNNSCLNYQKCRTSSSITYSQLSQENLATRWHIREREVCVPNDVTSCQTLERPAMNLSSRTRILSRTEPQGKSILVFYLNVVGRRLMGKLLSKIQQTQVWQSLTIEKSVWLALSTSLRTYRPTSYITAP